MYNCADVFFVLCRIPSLQMYFIQEIRYYKCLYITINIFQRVLFDINAVYRVCYRIVDVGNVP